MIPLRLCNREDLARTEILKSKEWELANRNYKSEGSANSWELATGNWPAKVMGGNLFGRPS